MTHVNNKLYNLQKPLTVTYYEITVKYFGLL
jgi:hypothetical protein